MQLFYPLVELAGSTNKNAPERMGSEGVADLLA